MAWQAQVQGGGVAALRAYLTQHLTDAQQKQPRTKLVLQCSEAGGANARLTASEMSHCAALLRDLRQRDPSTPSLRLLLSKRGGACMQATESTHASKTREEDAAATRARQAYMDKRRTKLLRMEEDARYNRLVRNVNRHTSAQDLQRNLKSAKQHLSIGANMVVARITAFIVVYMVSRPLTDNETTRMIAGLTGAVGMMFIEMVLFITRASKYDALEQQQKKHAPSAFE